MNDHRERLEEFGIPVDATEGLIDEKIASAFGQLAHGASAMQQAATSPEGDAVLAHLRSNPDMAQRVLRMAQADPEGAADYAVMAYRASGGGPGRAAAPRATTTMLPMPGLPAAQRGAEPWVPPVPDVEAAAEAYRRTGSRHDAERYGHARLRGVLERQFNEAGQSLYGD